MKQIALRLICFVLLIFQLPVFSVAQTQTNSNNPQTVTPADQRWRTESELRENLALYQRTGNKVMQANTLFSLGMLNFLQGNPATALEYYQQSLKLNEELGNKIRTAYTLNQMSLNFRLLGNLSEALQYAERALALSETLNNKELRAIVFMTHGLVQSSLENPTEALEFYQKSLSLGEELKNKALTANALEKIGGALAFRGKFDEALNNYQRSLRLNEETGNTRQIIFTLNGIGNVHFSQGNYARALENYEKSFRLSDEAGNKFQMAAALNRLAIIYHFQGESERGLEYFRQALKLSEEVGNVAGMNESLYGIAYIYRSLGKYVEALDYFHRTLKQHEKSAKKNGVISMLLAIAQIYAWQGNYAKAMEYSQKSLALSEETGHKPYTSTALNLLGDIYALQENPKQALEFAQRSTTLSRQTGNTYNLWNSLLISGEAYGSLKEFNKARQAFEEAITIVETSRAKIVAEENRTKYFATVQQSYDLYIDLLMQQHSRQPSAGNNTLAFEISERSRARSLLDLLSEANADIRQGVEPRLLERERSLQEQLNARAEQQTRLLIAQGTKEQLTKLQKEIEALNFEYRQVQIEIRRKSPRYAALTQPEPLRLSEIQREILDAETVLLEYKLGEKRSYLWLVTKDSLKSFELPPRAEIEATVRRAYSLLSDGKLVLDNQAQAEYETTAVRLSKILISPVAAQIKNKRLVIVADGALQYLSFGALPVTTLKETKFQPLITENEIVSLPSVSTLAVLRRETKSRSPTTKNIAVLADPVFTETDERLTAAQTNNLPGKPSPTRSDGSRALPERILYLGGESNGPLQITRLLFSGREADAILEFSPVGTSLKAVDFKASRETALGADLAQYRIVHFATHGLLNSRNPELSGIVLSLINDKGQPVNGFLRLNEIYNLNLAADLVVLSACQTALGKEIKGEGLVGLTRGFMYAGAPRVVASLWKVDDAATAELMKIFYQKMLKENMRPAAALRAAKIEMWKQKRWNAPFYWAAFELQGEWR